MARRFSSQLPPTKLSDELRQALQRIADEREIPLALAVREAIRLYVQIYGKETINQNAVNNVLTKFTLS